MKIKDNKKKSGFTLAELLIVVAIIAVLVAIAIPIFTSRLEKSRRAVDMANARNIMAVAAAGINDGTIEFGQEKFGSYKTDICISVNETGTSFSASGTVSFSGVDYNGGDSNFNRVASYMKAHGVGDYKLKSRKAKDDGWLFYTVIIYSDGTIRIASGNSADDSGKYLAYNHERVSDWWYSAPASNIEKAMGWK